MLNVYFYTYLRYCSFYSCVWCCSDDYVDYRERNTELIKEAIHVRYMLLPYFYTLFREANVTGVPVVRPLWMEFPTDEKTFNNDEAFMVGNSILVQGIYTEVPFLHELFSTFYPLYHSSYCMLLMWSSPSFFFSYREPNTFPCIFLGTSLGMIWELERHSREE